MPLIEDHYNVWSQMLGDILLKTGNLLDLFFGKLIFDPVFDDVESIRKEREKIKLNKLQCGIINYYYAFNEYYRLYDREIYILNPQKAENAIKKIIPFSDWLPEKLISKNNQLEWWDAYTKIKCNRFTNKREATLKVTLEALSALFVLLSLYPDTKKLLVYKSIIKSRYTGDHINVLIKGSIKKNKGLKEHEIILVETPLFGYVFEGSDSNRQKETCYFDHQLAGICV
ncbi:hypothetical protein [Methanosarcina horonobensis]|uniref:hypothetical protein n=1 Tax=Methanosarcina horonobensis TaxID=418008 RepID=UPI00138DFB10|nr:hypothetical protein [Methanosarcina horonobensis]